MKEFIMHNLCIDKMKGKHIFLVEVFLIGIFFISISSATSVLISPGSQSANLGDDIIVMINVSSVSALYGFQFDLLYDPGILQFVSISEGGFLNKDGVSTSVIPAITSTVGLIDNYAAARLGGSGDSGVSGSGALAQVTFSVMGLGNSYLNLSEEEIDTVNSSGGVVPISHTTLNGNYSTIRHRFYGKILNVTNGIISSQTAVSAYINGSRKSEGYSSNGDYALNVTNGINGQIVSFYLNGYFAKNYSSFSNGGNTGLNLTLNLSGARSLCGNSALDLGEECDSSIFGSKSCSNYGFNSGSLTCNSECIIVSSGCSNSGGGDNSGGGSSGGGSGGGGGGLPPANPNVFNQTGGEGEGLAGEGGLDKSGNEEGSAGEEDRTATQGSSVGVVIGAVIIVIVIIGALGFAYFYHRRQGLSQEKLREGLRRDVGKALR